MERFKIKNRIFIYLFTFLLFFALDAIKIKAISDDYNVKIKSVDNLIYGDKLKDGNIVIESQDIKGKTLFTNPDEIIDSVGIKDIELVFIPDNENEYKPKKIIYKANIQPREIKMVFDTVTSSIDKQYDGSDVVILPDYTYQGIINNEVSIIGNLQGKYSICNPKDNISINFSGIEIQGDKKDYYYLKLDGYIGTIHPLYLKDEFNNEINITLDKDIYIDNAYNLFIKKVDNNELINKAYSGFKQYNINLTNHFNNKIQTNSIYKVAMKVNEDIMNKERLEVFSLNDKGEYKILDYSYKDGVMYFNIDSNSSVVFATRNIEYHLIILFSLILLFSLVFGIIYRLKHSRI